jgi:peptide/nickel transport system substrate-binding protein
MNIRRITRRNVLRASGGAAAAIAAGGALRRRGRTAPARQGGGMVVTAIGTEPVGLDPCNPWNLGSGLFGMMNLPYDTWTYYDRNFALQPNLLAGWERVDEETVVFELRAGAKFHHSGREATTDDLVKTIERYTNPELGCAGSEVYTAQVKSLTPVDNLHFEVKVNQPGLLVQRIPLPLMPDPDYVAAEADPLLLRTEAGTGPWILDEWEPATSISFVPNPDYWGQPPALDGFRFQIIPEEATAIAALQTGQLNFLPFSTYESYELIKDDPSLNVWARPGFGYLRLNVNHHRPALQDPNVLQALRYGLNRQQMVDTLTFGLGQPSGPISPANEFYVLPADELAELQKYDPEQARGLLAQSGYDEENRLRLVCLSIADFKNFTDVATVAAANLREIGVDLEIRIQEIGVWVDSRIETKDYDLSVNDYAIGADPDFTAFRSDQDEQDWTGGGDPALDELINASNAEEDPAARQEQIYQIQRLMIENVRELYLYAPPIFEAASKDLVNYEPFPGSTDLRVFAWDQVTVAS